MVLVEDLDYNLNLAACIFLCLGMENTVAHLYQRVVPYWQHFQLLPRNMVSFGSIFRSSPLSTEEQETVTLDLSPGQITAVGASDCKTLMYVKRL